MKEKWTADFSSIEKSPFIIKTESSYNSYLSDNSLALCLKKPNFIAWVDAPDLDYRDQIIEADFRLESFGSYAAAGLLFRLTGDTYYLALVSSKGYFRIDAVRDSSPHPIIAWTEIAGFDGTKVNLKIIAYSTELIFLVNGRWLGEASNDLISSGQFGFALASYEAPPAEKENENICRAWLDYFSVNARTKTVEENYRKWKNSADINAESRLRLAETFAVMGKASLALDQLSKAWTRREEAARSVSATYTEIRTRKELLLAGRMALKLGQYREAEEFIDALLEQGYDNNEGKEALNEKVRILGELKKFAELREFFLKHSDILNKNSDMFALVAQSHWEQNDYASAAAAWDKAFKVDKENGVYAVNSANALELLDKKEEALVRFLEAGKLFLRQDNQAELSAMVDKMIIIGEMNWEARALAGKWAFSTEDYDRAESELAVAERLRRKLKPMPAADPAVPYLRGLISSLKRDYKSAVSFLAESVKIAPDYGLFRFKLAENTIYLNYGSYNPQFADEMRIALDLMEDPGGQMANYAGTLLFSFDDFKNASHFFEKAVSADPENIEYNTNLNKCLMKIL